MKTQIFNKMKIIVFLLVIIFIVFIGESKAALYIKPEGPFAKQHYDNSIAGNISEGVCMPRGRHHFSLIPRRAREAMEAMKDRQPRGGTGSNTNGIISISIAAVAVSLSAIGIAVSLGFTATVAVTTFLLALGFLGAIAAIVFGAIGKNRDGRRGLAIAGMVLGIVELSIAAFIGLAALLLISAF